MNAIDRANLEEDLQQSAAIKLQQALATMAEGLRLKRALLRGQYPELSESELDQLFKKWLFTNDDR